MLTASTEKNEWKDKLFALLLFGLAIELVFFKFIPDIGTATLPHQNSSTLVHMPEFEAYFMTPGVMYPRFFGTWLLHSLAKLAAMHLHSRDVRLSPLRIAAAILTPLYGALGLLPVLLRTTRYRWRTYAALYCAYNVISLYVFYPYDMPSIALISIGSFLVLEEQLGIALAVMLLTGIFRESSLHIVWCALVWAMCDKTVPVVRRAGWSAIFVAAFTAEYVLIRRFFPSVSTLNLNLYEVFFGNGLLSLTCLVTLAIVAIVPVHYFLTKRIPGSTAWRQRFFVWNCAAVPAWILFYRFLGGNISELRMLVPVLIPLFYGVALSSDPIRHRDQIST